MAHSLKTFGKNIVFTFIRDNQPFHPYHTKGLRKENLKQVKF